MCQISYTNNCSLNINTSGGGKDQDIIFFSHQIVEKIPFAKVVFGKKDL